MAWCDNELETGASSLNSHSFFSTLCMFKRWSLASSCLAYVLASFKQQLQKETAHVTKPKTSGCCSFPTIHLGVSFCSAHLTFFARISSTCTQKLFELFDLLFGHINVKWTLTTSALQYHTHTESPPLQIKVLFFKMPVCSTNVFFKYQQAFFTFDFAYVYVGVAR